MLFRFRQSIVLLIFTLSFFQGVAQMSWTNIEELKDYKKELRNLLKTAEKRSSDGKLMARIGECYYMLNQMKQAQSYYDKAISANQLQGKYILQYAKTLMALDNVPAARQWFTHYAQVDQKTSGHYVAQLDKLELINKIAPIYDVQFMKQNSSQAEMAVSLVGSDVYFLQNHASKGKSINKILADGKVEQVSVGIDLSGVSYFSFSGNGQMVCYTKQATYFGQRQIPEAGLDDELFIAAVSPTGQWVNPVKYTHTDSGFNCSYPSLSADGSTLYFSSNRSDGFGGQDIYLSINSGANWSFPVNMGSRINTPGDEISPFSTGESLYYSSNWNVGYGGFDIYRANKIGDSYTKVFHQGQEVNSSRDDYGFVFNPVSNKGYFISNRPSGNGLEDLYQSSKPDQNYVLNVKDALNNNSIQRVALDLSACGGSQTFTDANGQFVFQLIEDSGCRIRLEKPGYEISFVEISKARGKEYTVMLESSFPTVIGQVLDQNTGRGLADVKVAIENMATKEVQNHVTDLSGSFSSKLISGYTYQIRYFKQGFQSNTKTINTGTRVSKDVIGSVLLKKENVAVASSPNQPKPSTVAPAISRPTASPSPTTPAPTYSTPSRSGPAYSTGISQGFAVQLAAIKPNKPVDLTQYKAKLTNIGKVYIKEGSDYNRVRVGVFGTKAEAESAKSEIRAAGYGSAYVVAEEGDTNKSGSEELFTARNTGPAVSEYKIRLAALKNTGNVDRELLNRYGKIETTLSNGLTVFYLSGFTNISEAQAVMRNLQNQGYPGAFLMQKVNGSLERVK